MSEHSEAQQQQPVAVPDDVLSVVGSWALVHKDGNLQYTGRVIERLSADKFALVMTNTAGDMGELAFLTLEELTNPARCVLFPQRKAWAATVENIFASAKDKDAAKRPAAPDTDFGCRPNLEGATNG